jgi:hypothetical protein
VTSATCSTPSLSAEADEAFARLRDIAGLTATWSLEQTKKFLGYDAGTPMIPGVPEVSGPGPLQVPDTRTLSRRVAAGQGLGAQAIVTAGQTTDAVSNFYTDFRNMTVCWNDAIVLANESLSGYLPPPSDEELALVRAWDTRFGCQ